MYENRNKRKWAERRDMSEKSYKNYWRYYRDLGYRLIDFEAYEISPGNIRYAGVWRQNSDRPDWFLASKINEMAQELILRPLG